MDSLTLIRTAIPTATIECTGGNCTALLIPANVGYYLLTDGHYGTDLDAEHAEPVLFWYWNADADAETETEEWTGTGPMSAADVAAVLLATTGGQTTVAAVANLAAAVVSQRIAPADADDLLAVITAATVSA